jgi:AraC-like DNA-binding protein
MHSNFVDIVMVLAASQGVFLAVLIFHKHRRLFANRFLGVIMLSFSAILFNLALSDMGYALKFPRLTLVLIGVPFLAIPLHLLYARHLIRVSDRMRAREWLHFIPFALYESLVVPVLLRPTEEIVSLFRNPDVAQLPAAFVLFNWTVTLQGLVYMFWTMTILKRYVGRIKNMFSTIDKIRLDWLRNMTLLVAVAWVAFFAENTLLLFGINLSNFNLSSFLIACCVYVMGYLGLLKAEVFSAPGIAESIRRLPEVDCPVPPEGGRPDQTREIKYERSGLKPGMAKSHLERLLKFMESEKPYVNCDLTLGQLADRLALSPHNLSEVINTQLAQNFYDFVNGYRVEQVKRDLSDPAKKDYKLLAIALDSGFNSKTTFNTIFKKHTRLTPSEYRENLSR